MTARPAPARRSLRRDAAGSALIEFAIVMPVLLMLLLGTVEFGLNLYMRAVLEGAMQQAGRNSTLQTGSANLTTIDTFITSRVKAILPNANVAFARQNYVTFSAVGRPEDFTDSNGNSAYDATECFMDINGDGVWNASGGRTGLGGANDVVKYTATVTYNSLIPGGAAVFKISPTTSISATTILRNQPFATQAGWQPTQVCP